jgi:dienelactone hydrolase
MPDFLEGGLDRSLFPADTDEKKAAVAKVFAEGGVGNFDRRLKDLNTVAAAITPAYPSVQKIGAVGFCWGGKVTTPPFVLRNRLI